MKKFLFFYLICLYQITSYANASSLDQVSSSIFKIFTFHQTVKLKSPWQRKSPFESSGTGFLINQNRIVTNAHVVRNARYIEIKKPGDAKRYLASIAFIAHSSDLALLHVKDPSFFEGLTPLSFGDIPKLDSSVKTIGYPIGGSRLSVTNGVVSRIEKVLYSHSRIDEHLGIQTDAAINPGNSGGPVLQNGEVIGVAFQGIQSGDNIGYMIPTTVVHHFLKDSEDGKIDGTPEAGIRFISLPPVIRDYLKFPTNENGIFVVGTTEKGATQGILQKNDIVTHINGINIMDDGRIKLDGLLVDFYEIIERSQFNDKFNIRWFRKGEFIEKEIALKKFPLLINPGKKYPNQRPYLIFHGLVFVKLTGDYMRGFGKSWWEKLPQIYRSIYYYPEKYANDFKREYPIVLSNILKHPSNAHSSSFINKAIDSVNGLTIHSFSDLSKAFKSHQNGFHVIKFLDTKVPLILDASISEMTHHKLLKTYNIKSDKLIEGQKL